MKKTLFIMTVLCLGLCADASACGILGWNFPIARAVANRVRCNRVVVTSVAPTTVLVRPILVRPILRGGCVGGVCR